MGCKKCGECCKYVAIVGEDMEPEALRWTGYHGIKLIKQCGKTMIFIPNRCKMLNEDNTCSIYEDRPLPCIVTPSPTCREFQPPECKYFEEEK